MEISNSPVLKRRRLIRILSAIFVVVEFCIALTADTLFTLEEITERVYVLRAVLFYWVVLTLYIWFVINNHTILRRIWNKTTLILLDILLLLILITSFLFRNLTI